MRRVVRLLLAPVLVGVALALGGALAPHDQVGAYTPRVIMVDNDGLMMPANPAGVGLWGFAPFHITVTKGEQILFENPASNKLPHNVVSITRVGGAFDFQLAAGTLFNSSPTREELIMPGGSWTLDTSTLDPGQYSYYCSLHPWMLGNFTVLAP